MHDREAVNDTRPVDSSIDYTIETISAAEAKDFILRYEWLGTVGRPVARYGARNPAGELAAVALFGSPAQTSADNIFGDALPTSYKTICLERGADAS